MPRHKDANWNCGGVREPNGTISGVPWDGVHAAILMDIRDELKKLNTLLHCNNFTAIPHTLNSIRKNTTKKRRKVKKP